MTDGVYVATNYAMANSILLEGPDGLVIVDTTESPNSAKSILAAFRAISKKPIKAIVYTHYHGDHIFGARVRPVQALHANHKCCTTNNCFDRCFKGTTCAVVGKVEITQIAE